MSDLDPDNLDQRFQWWHSVDRLLGAWRGSAPRANGSYQPVRQRDDDQLEENCAGGALERGNKTSAVAQIAPQETNVLQACLHLQTLGYVWDEPDLIQILIHAMRHRSSPNPCPPNKSCLDSCIVMYKTITSALSKSIYKRLIASHKPL